MKIGGSTHDTGDRIPAVGIFIWNTGALNIRHIPHFKYSGSDGGGEFYAGTGSLGGLHAGGASDCRGRGSSCGRGAGWLCDRRTPDEDGDSCGISWHPHNVRALHHQPDCDGKQP